MLIRNYGLFLKKDEVSWTGGDGGAPGFLMGRTQITGTQVNFSAQRGVYVLYDGGFRIVYIGKAGAKGELLRAGESPGPHHSRLFSRLRSHATDNALAERWDRFSWFGVRQVNRRTGKLAAENINLPLTKTGIALNHLEAILIATAEPPLNRQGGTFGPVQRYLQVPKNEVVVVC